MAPIHKVALIQLAPKAGKSSDPGAPLEIESNFSRAESFIRKASSQGADLAVLPEYHLTGWAPTDPSFFEQASKWEIYVKKYQALAKELSINIVPGTIMRNNGSKLINVAYFITSSGDIAGDYQKKNLWHPERPHLDSSSHDPHDVIDTPLGKVGLLICWDLAFPEAFRSLIMQGAKIIIVPTFWLLSDCSVSGLKRNPMAESLFLSATLTARAYENTCAVVFVNAGGSKEENAAGLSQVAMPFVGPVEGSFKDGEEAEAMRVVEMDMEILNEAEDNYKVREDLARDDWHYGYDKATKLNGEAKTTAKA